MFLGGSLLTERGQDDVESEAEVLNYTCICPAISITARDMVTQISPLGKHRNVQTDFAVNYKRDMFQQIVWNDDYSNQNFETGTFKMNF